VQDVIAEDNFVITILPFGKHIVVARGTKLLDALLEAGFFTDKALCSGAGICGNCDVYIIDQEQKKCVKSCRTTVEADCTVEFPADGVQMNILTDGIKAEIPGSACCQIIQLPFSDSDDCISEWDRLQSAAIKMGFRKWKPALPLLRQLAEIEQTEKTLAVVVLADELLTVRHADNPGGVYGIAFDLGTTTVVGYLYDLTARRLLSTASIINPQTAVGGDVLSRIHFAGTDRFGTRKMARMIQQGLKDVTDQLLQDSKISREEVYEVVVAGNSCMQQLLLEVSSVGLGQSPYRPVTTNSVCCRASKIGLILNEMALLYCLPCIGGFVGGDTVGMMVACLPEKHTDIAKIYLAIDIGTNCEIVLMSPNIRIACSTAAGPAFEGGSICQGMRAADGAIDSVRIDGDISVHVIGNASAQGICGSGLVDAVAELFKNGIVDKDGRMLSWQEAEQLNLDPRLMERLAVINGIQTFLLSGGQKEDGANSVMLTQMDIRQLQLAKAAIQTSVRILLDMAGVDLQAVDTVFLAGAFGNYLDCRNAAKLGIIPEALVDRVKIIGNAAGVGASQVLLSAKAREKAEWLGQTTRHISLADHPDFQSLYLKELAFPNT